MKKISILLLSVCLSLANISCQTETVNTDPNTTNNGGSDPGKYTEANNFSLVSDADQKINLADYKDNVVVLFFFGSGCASCKAISPTIQSTFVDAYKDKKVKVIGLDTWDGSLNAVKSFRTNASLTFPLLLNASGVAKTYGTTYDRIVIVDKSGNVQFKGTKLAKNDVADAKKVVDDYLSK